MLGLFETAGKWLEAHFTPLYCWAIIYYDRIRSWHCLSFMFLFCLCRNAVRRQDREEQVVPHDKENINPETHLDAYEERSPEDHSSENHPSEDHSSADHSSGHEDSGPHPTEHLDDYDEQSFNSIS
jgi:hypothetical protein